MKNLRFVIAVLTMVCTCNTIAQPFDELNNKFFGEDLIFAGERSKQNVLVTPRRVLVNGKELFVSPKQDYVFTHASFKAGAAQPTLLVLGNDGFVLVLTFNVLLDEWSLSSVKNLKNSSAPAIQSFQRIVGDDVYAMSNRTVYVTRDSMKSWNIDSAGLTGVNACYDIAVNDNQVVFLCTGFGLYTQGLHESTWIKNTSYPSTQAHRIYIDAMKRIWISEGSTLRISTNGGQSFNDAPGGRSVFPISSLCGDSVGNIYLIQGSLSGGNELYYSAGGTVPFVRIDQSIRPLFTNYGNSTFYNCINADGSLRLGTSAGIFESRDKGSTWTYVPSIAEHVNSIVQTADKRIVISTHNGVFRRDAPHSWSKIFPSTGFIRNAECYTSQNSELFILGSAFGSNSAGAPRRSVHRSQDNGTSFTVDTSGAAAADLGMSVFFVDESGVQHAASSVYVVGTGNVMRVWKKETGGTWSLDTAGITKSTSAVCFGSSHDGKVYLILYNQPTATSTIYSRSVSGGSWIKEYSSKGFMFSIGGNNGVVTVGTDQGVVYNNDGAWHLASKPSTVGGILTRVLTSTKRDGLTWAYFETFNAGGSGNYGFGMFYTRDFSTWNQPNEKLDSIIFNSITQAGDSVFALSANYDGVYILDTNKQQTSFVEQPDDVSRNELLVFPNPTQKQLQFKSLALNVTTCIFMCQDEAGKTLVMKDLSADNEGLISIDISGLASGRYFYKLLLGSNHVGGSFNIVR